MRYFVDAEFNGFGGELIAIAAVPERDEVAPFYEAVDCPMPVPWVAANVLPVLQTRQWPLAKVAQLFSDYLASDTDAVLIADWPEDIAHAASLLTNRRGGRLIARSVRFELLGTCDFASEQRSAVPHNAYYDAVALRDWVASAGAT
ncbi:hypothetical protein [Sphingomonas sp. R86520]|uniref:hypothetical protein n=1 Tax=Sphingomonas sp. R86520 TaxID=3093859 RepID=UPI0036D269AD